MRKRKDAPRKGKNAVKNAKRKRRLTIPRKALCVKEIVCYNDAFDYRLWATQVDKAVARIQGMRINRAIRIMVTKWAAALIISCCCLSVFAQPNLSIVRVAPLPEPPVDSKVIIVSPNSDVKRVIETAGHGATIKFNSGLYNLGPIFIPVGVNVDLGLAEIVATQPGGFNQVQAVFWLKSASKINGNQWIRGGTIRGNNKAAGGVIVDGRDNIQISGIKFREFNFFGLWILNSSNGEARDLDFLNTSGAITGWASAEFCYFNISNWDIHHITVKTTSPSKGYGFKALYQHGFINNVRFAHITTDLSHTSIWNNGQSHNIGIELHEVSIRGTIIIENCNIGNQLSLSLKEQNQQGKIIIRNNNFDMGNDRYSIEGIANNLEIYGNTFKNSSQWIFNGKPTIKVSNWMVYNNIYDQGTAPNTGWGGVFLFGSNGAQGITIRDNKIRHKAGNEILKFQGISGGVNDIRSQNQITTF